MRVLITGASGLLGKALIEANKCHEIIATYVGNYSMQDQRCVQYFKMDIRDRIGYAKLFKQYQPQVTIHTAGIGSPDFAEQNKELVSDINLNGTKNIAENCELFNSKLIFISSNGIYDGCHAPYGEDDKAEPLNYYGMIKLNGEAAIKETRIPHAIVRPILMYGWNHSFERANIVTQSILKLQQGEKVYAYDDVYVNPLFNDSCAEVIWKMINDDKIGDYNIGGADRVSIYQLICKVAEIFNLDKLLAVPVQQGYFNELVARPQDTTLKTEKMEKELGIKPLSLDEGLALMIDAVK
jgi:dTDP-4-dehydrorhamnose reductase